MSLWTTALPGLKVAHYALNKKMLVPEQLLAHSIHSLHHHVNHRLPALFVQRREIHPMSPKQRFITLGDPEWVTPAVIAQPASQPGLSLITVRAGAFRWVPRLPLGSRDQSEKQSSSIVYSIRSVSAQNWHHDR